MPLPRRVQERYMGAKVEKRKIRRMNERKFVFDWDGTEDTSVDTNPLYNERHDLQLYGRCVAHGHPALQASDD